MTQTPQNFDLMFGGLNIPEPRKIESIKKPSFAKQKPVKDPAPLDPMLSNRVIEEPAVKAYEAMKRPRFNTADDWMKGKEIYQQFGLKSDQLKKPKFNSAS